jgi:hypothetical protein
VNSREQDRPPIFGFLWPIAPKAARIPVRHQSRFVRIGGRGALRMTALVSLFALIVIAAGGVMLAGFSSGVSGWTIAASAVLATACLALFRGAIAGTYVNDDGIAVRTLTRSVFLPWQESRVRVARGTVVIDHPHGTAATHLRRWSPDWPMGGERYAIAISAMRTWAMAHQAWDPDTAPPR